MANQARLGLLLPLNQQRLWSLSLVRMVALGTTDKDSILSLLSDNLLNIILGPVVLSYECEVPAQPSAMPTSGK